jgi:hypothetical protein
MWAIGTIGGGGRVDGVGKSVVALVHRPVSNSVMFFRAVTSLSSVTGATKGEPGDRCLGRWRCRAGGENETVG